MFGIQPHPLLIFVDISLCGSSFDTYLHQIVYRGNALGTSLHIFHHVSGSGSNVATNRGAYTMSVECKCRISWLHICKCNRFLSLHLHLKHLFSPWNIVCPHKFLRFLSQKVISYCPIQHLQRNSQKCTFKNRWRTKSSYLGFFVNVPLGLKAKLSKFITLFMT